MLAYEHGYDIGFQKFSTKLRDRLYTVASSNKEDLLICIPRTYSQNFSDLALPVRAFWMKCVYKTLPHLTFLSQEKKYGNAQITRPYLGQKDKRISRYIFEKFKLLFSNKKIVIVEGECTRFGVGNDLLHNAKSIKRIIVPSVDAFSSYESILLQTLKMDVDSTYLLSIGPTAKILAYDLFNTGRRVFDVGHLDLEYEWFLRCASKKNQHPRKVCK